MLYAARKSRRKSTVMDADNAEARARPPSPVLSVNLSAARSCSPAARQVDARLFFLDDVVFKAANWALSFCRRGLFVHRDFLRANQQPCYFIVCGQNSSRNTTVKFTIPKHYHESRRISRQKEYHYQNIFFKVSASRARVKILTLTRTLNFVFLFQL